MDGREDEEEVQNVEHNMGTVKTLKLRQAIGMVNRIRFVKMNKG
jgi:hypothetical protein